MKVKDQILQGMAVRQLTIRELAKAAGVSNQSVRNWTAGKTAPTRRHLPAVEKALGKKLDMSGVPSDAPGSELLADAHPDVLALLDLQPSTREAVFCVVRRLQRGDPELAAHMAIGALQGAEAALQDAGRNILDAQ